ncbi:unnamed protein product [Psylliodes chrysocephalus]|uniref:Odorant receptor n=1 Tax=Psylliodes chrysocephalus TaxID=3402493 RepID=A0A9P0G8X3_9CUCU|nr:unnamed protein product [Psylliodes chrysocephala]
MDVRQYKTLIFGEFRSFEDDPFYWMIDLATLLYRKKFHKILLAIIVCCFIRFFVLLLQSVHHSIISVEDIESNLVTISSALIALLHYLIFARTTDQVNSLMEQTKKLRIPYNLLNDSLKKEIDRINFNSKSLCCFCTCFILIGSIVAWLNKILNSQITNFIETDNDEDGTLDFIYDVQYQRKVQKKIKYFLLQTAKAKETTKCISSLYKYRGFIILTGSAVLLGIHLLPVISRSTEFDLNVLLVLSSVVVHLTLFFLIGEVGNTLMTEGENIYLNLTQCNWYNWNTSNRKLYISLLLFTQTPQCYIIFGFSDVNRRFMLQVFKIFNCFITCAASLKNK